MHYLKAKAAFYWICATIFGKVPYEDKFGLRYYIWKDTRLISTILTGVRTDDTGVIFHICKILDALVARKTQITCFDVGAYIGVISLAMASKMTGKGRVFAFEPSQTNYRRLVGNIELSGYSIIFPKNIGILDSVEDEVLLQITDDPGNTFIITSNQLSTCKAEKIIEKIRADTIYEFCKRHKIECIDILKIDAEGTDDKVLIGAKHLLASGLISYIICEFDQDTRCGDQCLSILDAYGYEILFIVRNGDCLVRSLDNYPFGQYKPPLNLLAISPRAPLFLRGEGLDIRS